MDNVFVEEYRKELRLTGYPFSVCAPLRTDTGYSVAVGTIEDASIYCEKTTKIPIFTAIEKAGRDIVFRIGEYTASFALNAVPEVVPLQTESGIFGGILVLSLARIRSLDSWKDGRHTITQPLPFCPRCIEIVPPVGVQRIITDRGEIMSGEIVISGGYGTTLQLLVSPAGITYIEVNIVGDPAYTGTGAVIPIQEVVCSDATGLQITMRGDESKHVSLIASNTHEGNTFDDALRVEGYGSIVRISLGGR